MFDEYNWPQKPYQLNINYIQNKSIDDLNSDIIDCIRYTIDAKIDKNSNKNICDNLYYDGDQ
jgi:hypothetical protein